MPRGFGRNAPPGSDRPDRMPAKRCVQPYLSRLPFTANPAPFVRDRTPLGLGGRLRFAQPGGVEPVGDLVRAALARGDGHGVAPDRGGLRGPLEEVVEDVRGGPGLDQAAQAEADMPALVALDALNALSHP